MQLLIKRYMYNYSCRLVVMAICPGDGWTKRIVGPVAHGL